MSRAGGRSSAAWRTFSTTPTISTGRGPMLLSSIMSRWPTALPGQESIRERRADQRDVRSVRPIALRERPSLQQPGTDGSGIAGRNRAEIGAGPVAVQRGLTGHGERHGREQSAQRRHRYDPDLFHARRRGNPVRQPLVETGEVVRRSIRRGQRHARLKHALRIEAGMDVVEPPQVLHQHDRRQQQNESRGNLTDDHDVPDAMSPSIADRRHGSPTGARRRRGCARSPRAARRSRALSPAR